ncbi:MAG: ABC transporter substrate-binding protein [Clostridiales bacterium]|jgi:iron(III) transport system substrate-binding protein|nr:ABC transporter substrate-binding protein [Clostridiales bacterium]
MKKLVIAVLSLALMLSACSGPGNNAGGGAEDAGSVYVYMPSPSGLADKLAAGFEAQTGIKVEQFQGTTGEILARLEAEAANPIADVVILASWADGLSMKAGDKLLAYAPANADLMHETWRDADDMLFGTSASAVGVIYNTTIFPELSADWADLAAGEYKDQLVFPDPTKSGAAKDFIAGYINNKGEDGWAVWEDMAANGMTVPGANAAALEAVTTGEKGILIAGVDYNGYSSHDKGEPINIYYPAGGTVINPRPAMILKTSPNVDNAKAFMDYLLSDEAQRFVADAYLLPGRSDVECENRSNVADIPALDCDWDWMMENAGVIADRINELCE